MKWFVYYKFGIIRFVVVAICSGSFFIWALSPVSSVQADGVEGPATLTADGVLVSLQSDKAIYKAGQTPKLSVWVNNTTGVPVTVTFSLSMAVSQIPYPFLRMLPIPKNVWQSSLTVSLAGSEQKHLQVLPDKSLKTGEQAIYSIQWKDQIIQGAVVTVPSEVVAPQNLSAIKQ